MARGQRALLFLFAATFIIAAPAVSLADSCPDDPEKTFPGVCGCGFSDLDSDLDGFADCLDSCPDDPQKIRQGACGCGAPDLDKDQDGVPICFDDCENDPSKISEEVCGCGAPDLDENENGIVDCLVNDELREKLSKLSAAVKSLRRVGANTQPKRAKALRARAKLASAHLNELLEFGLKNEAQITLNSSGASLSAMLGDIKKAVVKTLDLKSVELGKRRNSSRKLIAKVKSLVNA